MPSAPATETSSPAPADATAVDPPDLDAIETTIDETETSGSFKVPALVSVESTQGDGLMAAKARRQAQRSLTPSPVKALPGQGPPSPPKIAAASAPAIAAALADAPVPAIVADAPAPAPASAEAPAPPAAAEPWWNAAWPAISIDLGEIGAALEATTASANAPNVLVSSYIG